MRSSRILWGAAGIAAAVVAKRVLLPKREMNVTGKAVLLTGGRGLGLLMAEQLLAEGARVALCARDADELDRAKERLMRFGKAVMTVVCDITSEAMAQHAVAQVTDAFGQIDILINNAGVIQAGPFDTMDKSDYEEALATHFWGPYYLTSAVLPQMRLRKAGRILNIASIGGKIPVPHLLPYSTSKFAMVGWSEGLRAEVAKDGIVVTTVCPGLMRTGSPDNAFFKGQAPKEHTWFTMLDSLPGISMNAQQAAAESVAAMKRGDAEVILSLPALLGAKAYAMFPSLVVNAAGWINRALPDSNRAGKARERGSASHTAITRSPLTWLTQKAARDNNELPPG